MPTSRKPTHADAELALKLYDLRRESEMRKARNFFTVEFWPERAEDVMKHVQAFGAQENAWLRQVVGYWEMAASFVVQGVLHEQAFYDSCSEAYFLFAKVRPILKDLRVAMESPQFFGNLEKVVLGSKQGRERIEDLTRRIEKRRAMMADQRKKVASA
jgi:hypothetical protein